MKKERSYVKKGRRLPQLDESYTSHYHRCRKCHGFYPCEAATREECLVVIEENEENQCGLSNDELNKGVPHGLSVRQSLYEMAAVFNV